ncbi:cytochrome P450 [Lasiosphaeria hispida]|uniref:Cytochrome P450 n=1 Tax=Lasiosphaeria hispida TaxID=260671 RepID=A0AAJ0HCA9_9PEZI|nr:cytochrome P450 [Lasiosphaeria hispida]
MAFLASAWDESRPRVSIIVISSLVGLLVVASIFQRLQRWQQLRHVPGPRLAGFTSLWITWRHIRATIHEECKDVAEKYGPLVRIGPNEVICTDLETIHRICSFKSGYRKDNWYRIGRMSKDQDSVFTTLDPELRREKKKKISPAYAGKGSDSFEHGVDRGIAILIDSIETRYANQSIPMDLARQVHFGILDTLGEVAYSKPLGFLANNKDMGNFLKINEETLPFVFILSNYVSIFKLLHKWPFNLLLPRAGDQVGLGAVMGFTTGLIDQRLRPGVEPQRDILQSFIANGLTREELVEEVTLQFFAGTDTTASSITMTLLYLLATPSAYRKLQKEIGDGIAKGLVSSPIQDVEARQMPYLQACIREGLRLMPPLATGAFYKAVPEGGDTVCGHYLPPGTRVATGSMVYAMGRSKAFWGGDADVFRPDRWLEADEDRRLAMTMTVDLAFGHGQFGCLGKAIAFMELSKAVAEILRRYDLSIVNPTHPLKIFTAIAWVSHDLWVKVERR